MSAYNTSETDTTITTDFTAITLPAHPILDGFLADITDTIFTVPVSGRYLISYQINVSPATQLRSDVLLNSSAPIAGLIYSAHSPQTVYINSSIVDLSSGDTLGLTLSALMAQTTLDIDYAFLNVIRLS